MLQHQTSCHTYPMISQRQRGNECAATPAAAVLLNARRAGGPAGTTRARTRDGRSRVRVGGEDARSRRRGGTRARGGTRREDALRGGSGAGREPRRSHAGAALLRVSQRGRDAALGRGVADARAPLPARPGTVEGHHRPTHHRGGHGARERLRPGDGPDSQRKSAGRRFLEGPNKQRPGQHRALRVPVPASGLGIRGGAAAATSGQDLGAVAAPRPRPGDLGTVVTPRPWRQDLGAVAMPRRPRPGVRTWGAVATPRPWRQDLGAVATPRPRPGSSGRDTRRRRGRERSAASASGPQV